MAARYTTKRPSAQLPARSLNLRSKQGEKRTSVDSTANGSARGPQERCRPVFLASQLNRESKVCSSLPLQKLEAGYSQQLPAIRCSLSRLGCNSANATPGSARRLVPCPALPSFPAPRFPERSNSCDSRCIYYRVRPSGRHLRPCRPHCFHTKIEVRG